MRFLSRGLNRKEVEEIVNKAVKEFAEELGLEVTHETRAHSFGVFDEQKVRGKIKDEYIDLESVETEINKELKNDVGSIFSDFYLHWAGMTTANAEKTKSPTLLGKVNAIIKHLGIEVDVKQSAEPQVRVKKKRGRKK